MLPYLVSDDAARTPSPERGKIHGTDQHFLTLVIGIPCGLLRCAVPLYAVQTASYFVHFSNPTLSIAYRLHTRHTEPSSSSFTVGSGNNIFSSESLEGLLSLPGERNVFPILSSCASAWA